LATTRRARLRRLWGTRKLKTQCIFTIGGGARARSKGQCSRPCGAAVGIGEAAGASRATGGFAGFSTAPVARAPTREIAVVQLLGVVEGRWAAELWLAHKAAATTVEPEVAQVIDRFFARVEGVDRGKGAGKEEKEEEGGINIYFKVKGVEGAEQAVTLRLYTDFHRFRLYCDCKTSAKRVLEAVAEELRPAVGQLERRLRLAVAKERLEWPRWHRNALELPAGVG